MNIGKEISNIRKERKMTQEEFGRLFHVTRQTVSNWENEKSYPDLQILVEISERFEVSLDKLLKEDKQMVKVIDEERHRGRVGKYIVGIAAVILIICIGYAAVWNVKKNSFEKNYEAGLQEYGFTQDILKDGEKAVNLDSYSVVSDNITYTVYKEKFPGILEFDFKIPDRAKFIIASCSKNGETIRLRMDKDWTTLALKRDMIEKDNVKIENHSAEYPLDDSGQLKGENIESDVKSAYEDMEAEVQTAVKEMKNMYQTLYN